MNAPNTSSPFWFWFSIWLVAVMVATAFLLEIERRQDAIEGRIDVMIDLQIQEIRREHQEPQDESDNAILLYMQGLDLQ